MKRLDLIIEYLNNIGEVTFAHQGWDGVERLNKALAYARELRKLEPVAWPVRGFNLYTQDVAKAMAREHKAPLFPLYALGDADE